MKLIFTVLLLLTMIGYATGQTAIKDTTGEKEGAAVFELGGAASQSLTGGKSAYGYNLAVEVTPIEDWLELELGFTPTYAAHLRATEIDLLFKKPWTFSPKAEFMVGLGLAWDHTRAYETSTNSAGGEVALDFMFWPFARHRFGWFVEPAYEYDFGRGHEQSLGFSGGVLVAVP